MYQPNSFGGPREDPRRGYRHFPAPVEGPRLRIRPESFADHYSQARQFYISQTEIEQGHIAAALTFELSKVETPAIRARMVAHLLNIDEGLGRKVATGLRLRELPEPADAAMPTRTDLKRSPALSIILNGPESFKGRKVGALVTDGADMTVLQALKSALEAEGAMLKLVAPMVGGIEASDGTWLEADEKIDGGPAVLFDAVAIIPSREGAVMLAREATARDFVSDAFAHLKFIAYTEAATPLLEKAGVLADKDEGFVPLAAADDAKRFVQACRKLRLWSREAKVKQV
jgi:catalase